MSTTWQRVHLFISSTFNDMHAERDYLVKRVFPDLRDWCEDRKLRLVDIDLRWGVTEADASNKNAVKICLEHINKCRPFFVCFLGQRHGYAPGQEGISSETFNEFPDLRSELHPAASITELEIRHAIFRPLTWRDPEDHSRLIHYNLAEHAFFYFREPGYLEELKEPLFAEMQLKGVEARDASDPQELNGAARQSFCTYTDEIGPEDERDDEREERKLSIEALQDLRRDIVEHDITQSLAHRPVKYKARWRSDLRAPELALPLECPFQDETGRRNWRKAWNRWAHLGLDSADLLIPESKQAAAQRHNETLTRGRLSKFRTVEETREQFPPSAELARIIQHDLREAILARYPDRRELPETTELQREIDQHEEFISNSVEGFIERGDDFVELDRYVESDSNKLFVLTAAGGMGKSTLLANWMDRYRARIKDLADHSIHFRFIGQSDESGTVYALLRSLLGEIKEVALKLDEEIPLDPRELRQKLPDLLAAIGRRGPSVIVIDALDQLESGISDLNWIPRQLPENIKLIVSFKREGEASEEVFRRFESSGRVHLSEVKPFENEEDRESLVRVYLLQYLKELDKPHLEALIRLRGASNPLYLKIVLSELRVFGAFASLREKIRSDFGDTPVSAFAGVLNRLESDPAYSPIDPKEAVPLLFGLLAHARRGLSVEELTSLFIETLPELEDNQEWREAITDTIYLLLRQVRPFMARREGRYDFFFNSFRLAALECYVARSPEDQIPKRPFKEWHGILAEYFYGLPTWQEVTAPSEMAEAAVSKQPTRRKVAELPFHLTQAEEWKRLEETLCDLEFIEAKCAAGITYDLVSDYHAALTSMRGERAWLGRDRVEEFSRFVQGQAHILLAYPALTFQQAANQPDSTAPAQTARKRFEAGLENRPWLSRLNKPQQREACLMTLTGHIDYVRACAFSPDGNHILSASWDRTLKLWDLRTGRELATITGHTNRVTGCAFSHDGSRILSCSVDKTIKVWDPQTGENLITLTGHEDGVTACAFSADASRIASVSDDKTLRIWNAQTGEELLTLRSDYAQEPAFFAFQILQWDGSEIGSGFTDCAFSPDGRRILSASRNGTLIVWDAKTGEKRAGVGEWHEINACAFSPDGGRILSASVGKTLSVWDSQTREELVKLSGHTGSVESCAFSPDGSKVLSGSSDKTLRLWDAQTGTSLATFSGHVDDVNACAFSSDGNHILSASDDATLRVWDTHAQEDASVAPHRESITICTFAPDGRHIVSGSRAGTLKIWDAETGRQLITLPRDIGRISTCSFSPSGKAIVSATNTGMIYLRDTDEGKELTDIKGHGFPPREVNRCVFSPDGSQFVSASGNHTLKLWDTETGQDLLTLAGHAEAVTDCAFSPDGRRILSASADGTLKLWDSQTGEELVTLSGHAGSVKSCAFSPDGSKVLSSSDKTLHLWDAQTGTRLATFRGHLDDVNACAFSSDGNRILSASDDATLKLWDAPTCQEIATLRGHNRFVAACVFSPDGSHIVSASRDNTLKLWDARDGLEILHYPAGGSTVAWSPTAALVVVGCENGEVHILQVRSLNPGFSKAAGDGSGEWHLLDLNNFALGAPILTAWRPDNLEPGCAVGCPFCRTWSEIPASALSGELDCPACGRRVRLNPFTINADWRPLARAWRGVAEKGAPGRERAFGDADSSSRWWRFWRR